MYLPGRKDITTVYVACELDKAEVPILDSAVDGNTLTLFVAPCMKCLDKIPVNQNELTYDGPYNTYKAARLLSEICERTDLTEDQQDKIGNVIDTFFAIDRVMRTNDAADTMWNDIVNQEAEVQEEEER